MVRQSANENFHFLRRFGINLRGCIAIAECTSENFRAFCRRTAYEGGGQVPSFSQLRATMADDAIILKHINMGAYDKTVNFF